MLPDAVTVKLVALISSVPPAVLTWTAPVAAPLGTVKVIDVSETTLYVAGYPSRETAVAPVKPEPVTVTVVPIGPLVGEKDVIAAPAVTVKLVVLTSNVPLAVLTWIDPVAAPLGTVNVIDVSETTVYVAG
jgi:hypothetical protein